MEIYELIQEERPCSYLPEQEAKMRYLYIKECTAAFYLHLLERGWRRFGNYFFVPICSNCNQCVTIRQDCERFVFSKSHKRILKNPLLMRIRRPWVSEKHLELYDKYHRAMQDKKGWEYHQNTLECYYDTFVRGFLNFGYEFDYYIEDRLIGVAYVDVLENAISAVYCYYDHDFSKYSIGTYSILKQIEIAKRYNIKYLYPGYWIKNHHSMGYKDRFRPFEILHNRPNLNEESIWIKE